MPSIGRVAAVLLVFALLATACGARLSDEEREFAVSGGGASGATGQQRVGGSGPDDGEDRLASP
jgi:hypothetical protein